MKMMFNISICTLGGNLIHQEYPFIGELSDLEEKLKELRKTYQKATLNINVILPTKSVADDNRDIKDDIKCG